MNNNAEREYMKNKRNIGFIFVGILMLLIAGLMFETSMPRKTMSARERLTMEEKAWLYEQGSLTYSADDNAPPLRFVDESDKQYKGVVVDYVSLLSLELGVNIEVRPMLWQEALKSLSEGETDMCDMFKSPERSEVFLFSDPIYNLRAVLVTRGGPGPIDEMTFATQKGDYLNEWLLENYPDIEIVYTNNVGEAIDLLLDGEVEAVAGDEPVVLYQMKKKDAEDKLQIMERPLYENEVVFSIPKSKPELLPILNKGIEALAETDQLERIQQKWFGISTPIVQEPDMNRKIRNILAGVGMLIVLMAGMAYWNYSLQSEVERRTKEVISSKENLKLTLDGMKQFIALFNMRLETANINGPFLDYLGLTRSEARGKVCSEIFKGFKPIDITSMIRECVESESGLENEISVGKEYYMLQIYPLKNTEGKLKNILVVLSNVTKEKTNERQLLQAGKMAAIGQLVAGMGHEIRNPLGIIRNHSFILRSMNPDEKTEISLDYIDSAVERANRIIGNLLEFSRLTDDSKQKIGLKNLISGIFDLESKTLMKKNIGYEVSCEDCLNISSNRESLKHIFINLISNAVDAIGENGSIRVLAQEEENNVKIRVEDSGDGISEDEIENIFNPFYTTKCPDKGTGLGLYIVYNEIKKLGGAVYVESTYEEGTAFEIMLPKDGGVKNDE